MQQDRKRLLILFVALAVVIIAVWLVVTSGVLGLVFDPDKESMVTSSRAAGYDLAVICARLGTALDPGVWPGIQGDVRTAR